MLRFVVALAAEARPLISRYRLERDVDAGGFDLYRRDDVALVVSGLGKVASAAAAAFLQLAAGGRRYAGRRYAGRRYAGRRHLAWMNVGIAGHGTRDVGEAILAHAIRDRASGRSWYPPHVFAHGLATDSVVTVDTPELRFLEDGAHEMEASGFYPTACRFSSAELVQCVKVISDGPGAALERLSAKRVESLVEARIEEVAQVAAETLRLAAELRALEAEPPELRRLAARFRFTVTEARQLRRLVARWRTLTGAAPLPEEDFARLRHGRDVLRHLQALLEAAPVELGG